MSRRFTAALVLMAGLVVLLTEPAPAQAHGWQASARLGLGFGKRFADPEQERLIFAPSLRAEVLQPPGRRPRLRWGPAAELRTSDFSTFEGGAGLALNVSLGDDVSLGSHTLLGGAYRDEQKSTATLAQLLTVGFRDWDERPHYAFALNLFLSARAALSEPSLFEFTGGVEVDGMVLAIPFLRLRDALRRN